MIVVTNATFILSHCFSFRIAATHVVSGLAPLVLSHNSKEYPPSQSLGAVLPFRTYEFYKVITSHYNFCLPAKLMTIYHIATN